MSILDLQAFVQDVLSRFDQSIDTSSGSKADTTIIQPLLRRLGPDPFAMDVRAFLFDRLNQEFPSFATRDGDALSDLLVKPMELFLDPVVRENQRVRQNLSFRDAAVMTVDEAEALGGNFFVDRDKGDFAKGQVRVYFSQPQSASITPVNYLPTRTGLNFFPDGVQSVKVDEMLFNQEGDLYYFDINVIAEMAGDQYNVDVDEVISISNFTAAVKVTNKRRIRGGLSSESVVDYVARIRQEITERSLVTKRGITARLMESFPEMTRLNIAGFNDPEMQRDIIEGGGLGPVAANGLHGFGIGDGEGKPLSRRFKADTLLDGPVDFTALVGPPGSLAPTFILVVHGTFLGAITVQDVQVRKVVDAVTLDLEDQIFPLLSLSQHSVVWELRRKTITLSKIPGGILFPDSSNGTVTIPDDQIHIGGATDTYLRGTVLDTSSLIIDGLTDDSPVLSGLHVSSDGLGNLTLHDLILSPFVNANYNVGDPTYESVATAAQKFFVIQVLNGVGAGTYSIVSATQPSTLQGNPAFFVFGAPPPVFGDARWRLVDVIDVNLNEPKETRIAGNDLQVIQATTTVTTAAGVNFDEFGVAVGDTLRILSGQDVGSYTVKQVTPFPFFTQVVIDRPVTTTSSGLKYIIFRPNAAGGVSLPLIRITSIDLLDSNKQPVGSTVPYAKPIGVYSFSFSNPARGVKLDLADTTLGIVSLELPAGANIAGTILQLRSTNTQSGLVTTFPPYTFTGVNPVPLSIVPGGPYPDGGILEQVDLYTFNNGIGPAATLLGNNQFGIIPSVGKIEVIGGTNPVTSAIELLFGTGPYPAGTLLYLTSEMARAKFLDDHTANLAQEIIPPLDLAYDVLQVIDGVQTGARTIQYVFPYPGTLLPPAVPPAGLTHPTTVVVVGEFAPEVTTHTALGARSLGKARLYFLDPTSFEVGADTIFHATLGNGTIIDYRPDPQLDTQIIPPLPAGPKAHDGTGTSGANAFVSASTNFNQAGARAGDILIIDYVPIIGTVALTDPVVNLAFTTIILEFEDGIQKTITFVNDNGGIPATDVTRAGVATQINSAVGKTICKINATNNLQFDPEVLLIILSTGTANPLLGFNVAPPNQDNQAPFQGRYDVLSVNTSTITVSPVFPVAVPPAQINMQFKVFRQGAQRIGTTQMSTQLAPAGLYYADIELVSNGTGDQFNIDADTPMTVESYRSDGYFLTTDDSNLSFSTAEQIRMHISRTINTVGTNDDPADSTNLIGQNVQVNYELSALVSNTQSFLQADLERVICASPLARHLVPHFIRFDVQYTGGPKAADVLLDIQTLIQATFPDQQVEVSDITAILSQRGTTSIQMPITLFGVVYNNDRSVTLEKSQDRINVGRLAAFIPDEINLTRNLI